MSWNVLSIVLTVIFGLVSIVSVIIAIRLARKQKPTWAYRTRHIIGPITGEPPELKVMFAGQDVTDVYRTLLLFCNKGNEKLERDDVASQLIVRFRSARVLKVTVLETSRDAIKFEATRGMAFDESEADEFERVYLEYEWLGHGDGATVEVLHTKCENVTLTAQFKNTRIYRLRWENVNRQALTQNTWLLAFLVVLSLVMWILTLVRSSENSAVIAGAATSFGVLVAIDVVPRWVRYLSVPKWARKM